MKKRWLEYKRKKVLIISLIILVFLILIYFTLIKGYSSFLHGALRNVGINVDKIFLVEKKISYINVLDLEKENLKNEINRLKDLLELNSVTSDFEYIHATVISRNTDYWFHTITIDKGKKDGLKEDMAVINEDGLIGRVERVFNTTSLIKLITTNSGNLRVAVSVLSDKDLYNGIIDGFNLEENLVLVTSIRSNSNIKKGSIVKTNGLGKIFPSGLYVGEVVSITTDSLGVRKILKVKSKVNFEDLRYVSIIAKEK